MERDGTLKSEDLNFDNINKKDGTRDSQMQNERNTKYITKKDGK